MIRCLLLRLLPPLTVLIGLLVSSLAAAPAFPVTVTDARGVAVTLRAAPRRIVSLSPGTTEMLFALGLGKSVVGDTVYCDYPPAAQKIAKIGDVTSNYEKVVALKPDLVVGDAVANRAAVARLGTLHLPLFAVQPTSLPAVETSLRQLGRVTGTDRAAAKVVAQMEAKRKAAAGVAARDHAHPKVLIVIGLNPLWTAGRGTFIDEVVREAGGVNIASSVRGYAPLSKEKVLADPPDRILISPKDQAALRRDPVLGALPASRAGRFFFVTDGNLLMRPGPRLADGLLQVARALHPRVK